MSARVATATLIVSVLLAAGGCGGSNDKARSAPEPTPEASASTSEATVTSTTQAATTAATPTQAKTPQGWLIKGVFLAGRMLCSLRISRTKSS